MPKADGHASEEGPADDAREVTPPHALPAAEPPRTVPRPPTREVPRPVGARLTQSAIPAQGGAAPVPPRRATGQVPVAAPPRRAPSGELKVPRLEEETTGPVPMTRRATSGELKAPRLEEETTGPQPIPRRATSGELKAPRLEEETTGPQPIPRRATGGVAAVGRKATAEQALGTGSLPRRASTGVAAQPAPSRPAPPVAEPVDEEPTAPLSPLPSRRDASLPPPVDELPDAPTSVGVAPVARTARDERTDVQPALDLDALEATPTPIAPLPAERRRGLSADPTRRKPTASPAADPPPDELSRVIRLEAARNGEVGGRRFGFQLAIGLVMLVVGVAAFAAFFAGHVEKPPLETLQLVYPYGFTGGRMPNGRMAPSVSDLIFDFTGSVDCGGEVCARYDAHSADDSFHMTLDLKKVGADWKLANPSTAGQR